MLRVSSSNIVYPPNKILKRKCENNTLTISNYLIFLDFNKNGQSIVSSSNLNGTSWQGNLLYFDCENNQNLRNLKFSQNYIGPTTSDGKFLNTDTIVVAEDDGHLNVLKCLENKKEMQSVKQFKEVDRIPKLSVWDSDDQILTCSENNVAVWNLTQETCQRFNNYHTEIVNCVDTVKCNKNIFVSTSEDFRCCLWDVRKKNPVSVLHKSDRKFVRSIACDQNNANFVAIGKEDGDVCLVDLRNLEVVSTTNCKFDVHRLVFDESAKLAVCGDSNKVVIWNCNKGKYGECIYSDNLQHSNIVRGLSWYKSSLYSCGFDKLIIKHQYNL